MRTPQEFLAVQAWIQHPLPWRIEYDWTAEVHAADGYIVAKCSTVEEAESVIEWAKEQQRIIDSLEWDDGTKVVITAEGQYGRASDE